MKRLKFAVIIILFMLIFSNTKVIGASTGFGTKRETDGTTVLAWKDSICGVSLFAQYLGNSSNTEFRKDFFAYNSFLGKVMSSYKHGATYNSQVTYKTGMCLMHGAGNNGNAHYKITGVLTTKWDTSKNKLVTISQISGKTVKSYGYGAELSYIMHLNDLHGSNGASTKWKYTIAYFLSKRNKFWKNKSTRYVLCSFGKCVGRCK